MRTYYSLETSIEVRAAILFIINLLCSSLPQREPSSFVSTYSTVYYRASLGMHNP
jgi:hypothetical protein